MIRRASTLPVLLGLALAACGEDRVEGTGLSLTLLASGAAPAATYDLRVFGGAAHCEAILAEPSEWLTARQCEPAETDELAACHLAHVVVQPGATSRIEGIAAGARAVFAVGRDAANSAVSRGCAEVLVKDGEAAAVTLTLVDAPW